MIDLWHLPILFLPFRLKQCFLDHLPRLQSLASPNLPRTEVSPRKALLQLSPKKLKSSPELHQRLVYLDLQWIYPCLRKALAPKRNSHTASVSLNHLSKGLFQRRALLHHSNLSSRRTRTRMVFRSYLPTVRYQRKDHSHPSNPSPRKVRQRP